MNQRLKQSLVMLITAAFMAASPLLAQQAPDAVSTGTVDGKEYKKEADKKAIERIIQSYLAGWRKLDAQILAEIWDKTYDRLSYWPAELDQPITGWKGIEQYYEEATNALEIKEFRASDPVIDVFGDVAYASPKTFFSAVTKETGEKTEAEGRVSFILRKESGKWLVTNYLEPH